MPRSWQVCPSRPEGRGDIMEVWRPVLLVTTIAGCKLTEIVVATDTDLSIPGELVEPGWTLSRAERGAQAGSRKLARHRASPFSRHRSSSAGPQTCTPSAITSAWSRGCPPPGGGADASR
jgi:hypothetical protein